MIYQPGKASQSLWDFFCKQEANVFELPISSIEDVRQNMEALQQSVETNNIDLVVASDFNAFLALALPAEVKKLVICPVIDPQKDSVFRLGTRVVFSEEDYKYMRAIRRIVNGYISVMRKRNTYAIFLPFYDHANQHGIYELKYGHKNITNWTDYTGRGKRSMEHIKGNKSKDYFQALDANTHQIISSFSINENNIGG